MYIHLDDIKLFKRKKMLHKWNDNGKNKQSNV